MVNSRSSLGGPGSQRWCIRDLGWVRCCECFGNILRFNVIGGSGVLKSSQWRASSFLILVRSVDYNRGGALWGLFITGKHKIEFGTA